MKHILQREYHINFDDTWIVSDLGWCNIYRVFDSVVEELDKDQIQTLKKRSNDLRRNVINYNWMDRVGNGYGIPLTEEQGAKDIEIIKNDFVFKGFYNNGIGKRYRICTNVTTLYNWKI